MKLLKLTNTPECLRIAQAFVGSQHYLDYEGYDNLRLLGIYQNRFILGQNVWHRMVDSDEINLPLEILKICPFVAMRESLIFDTNANGYGKGSSEIITIDKTDVIFKNKLCYTITKYEKTIPSEFLDLDWIQTIPGASIEDVE